VMLTNAGGEGIEDAGAPAPQQTFRYLFGVTMQVNVVGARSKCLLDRAQKPAEAVVDLDMIVGEVQRTIRGGDAAVPPAIVALVGGGEVGHMSARLAERF